MLSYKSFKGHKMFENNQQDQVDELIKLKEFGVVNYNQGSWIWNSEKNQIDFTSNLRITPRFTGNSLLDLPFRIGSVEGHFVCSGIDSLRSLEGGPAYVKGDFDASSCNLRSLEGSPEVCENFSASYNLIRNIQGSPKYVFGDFDLSENLITNLDLGPLIITGSCKLLGNQALTSKESVQSAKEFSNMHREITYDSLVASSDFNKMYEKTKEKIEKEISNQSYVTNLITKNPAFSKFLGRFKKDVEEFSFIKGIKDFGIL